MGKLLRRVVELLVVVLFCTPNLLEAQAPTDGLMAHFKLDGDLADEMGGPNGFFEAGLIQEDTTEHFAEGFDGTAKGALWFPGGAMWYRVGLGKFSPLKDGVDGEMTVTFWAKWDGVETSAGHTDIINKRDTWSEDGMMWTITHHEGCGYNFSIRQPESETCTELGLPEKEWAHVAVGLDPFGTAYFWLNGGDSTATHDFTPGTKDSAMIHAGTSPNDEADAYNGALDDIRFYNRLLTDQEVKALYESDISTGIEEELQSNVPARFHLGQNFPNPFNPETRISYTLYEEMDISIKVFDSNGNLVEILVDETKPTGSHTVEFNSAGLPSGVYFYVMSAGELSETNKMVLLK